MLRPRTRAAVPSEDGDRSATATVVQIGATALYPQKTLSVVMPVHGGAMWLPATLASLADEIDEGTEVILIDSSPDTRSIEIAASFSDRLQIRVLHRPDLVSWVRKTNLAVALAQGVYVAMLHQDDLWLPGRMKTLRRWITSAPDAAMHLAPTRIVDARGRAVGEWRCPLRAGTAHPDELLKRLIVQCFVSVPAPLFRRDAFLQVGGMDPDLWYTADWDLWLKLARAGPVVYNREVTTGFRIHAGSLTMKGSRDQAAFAEQLHRVLARHRSAGSSPRSTALAETSVRVNIALASAANGSIWSLLAAMGAVARLGPLWAFKYLYQSRLLDRAIPRVRAKLAGAL